METRVVHSVRRENLVSTLPWVIRHSWKARWTVTRSPASGHCRPLSLPLPLPKRRRLFARPPLFHPTHLCSCDRRDLSAASDETPSGWVKDGITSLGSPTSRSCQVEEVWPAYDVQDAGLMGVDHLHATVSTVSETSEKVTYGVWFRRGRKVSSCS